MNVLVTGGNGFIGQHLCRRLLADGCNVVVLDDLSGSRREDIIEDENLTFVEGSTSNPDVVDFVMDGADVVYHLACVTGHKAVRDHRSVYDEIVSGAANIICRLGQRKAWFFSSSAALGGGVIRDADEEYRLDGSSYDGGNLGYGAGKAELERLVAVSRRDITVIRPFNIVGRGQTGRYGMVIPTFVGRALLGMPIIIYDDGAQSRNYGNVDAFIYALLQLDKRDAQECVYNIGSPHVLSVNDLADIVDGLAGYQVPREYKAYSSVFDKLDVAYRSANMARTINDVGTIPWVTPFTIVKNVFQWMQGLSEADLKYFAGVA